MCDEMCNLFMMLRDSKQEKQNEKKKQQKKENSEFNIFMGMIKKNVRISLFYGGKWKGFNEMVQLYYLPFLFYLFSLCFKWVRNTKKKTKGFFAINFFHNLLLLRIIHNIFFARYHVIEKLCKKFFYCLAWMVKKFFTLFFVIAILMKKRKPIAFLVFIVSIVQD